MQDYDVVMKKLLEKSARRVTGIPVARWLPTELPKVQNLRIDLLGETTNGELIQLEVQSSNEADVPFRMLEYLVGIARAHKKRMKNRIPRQILLYVGREPLDMPNRFEWPAGVAHYTLIDMRELDAQAFLDSNEPSDNVLGVLARLRDRRAAVHGILEKIAALGLADREFFYRALLILAGLRPGTAQVIEEEVTQMPLSIDIREHEVLGPMYDRAVAEGEHKGQLVLLRQLIEQRLGSVPEWVEQKLSQFSTEELGAVGGRVLKAASFEDLFR